MTPPRPQRSPPETEAAARAERASRSLEEPLDLRLKRREPYPLLEVRNPIHRTAYLVMFPEYPLRGTVLCTCTDFARRGLGTCKHIEAANRAVEALVAAGGRGLAPPPPAPSGAWAEIDLRESALPTGDRLSVRDLARPGAVLFG